MGTVITPMHAPAIIVCAPLLVAVGCADPQPGTVVTFDDFCDAKYDRAPGDGSSDALTRVTIEGYPAPPTMFSLCSTTCSFDLFEQPQAEGRTIRFSVKLGSGKNRLEPLPERFEPSDFQLHTQDGNTLGFHDKVRLTGKRLGTAAQNDCQLYSVDLIQTP